MNRPARIALIQSIWTGDRDSMEAQYRTLVGQAAEQNAEIVCLPEFSLSPYFPGTRDKSGFDFAEPIPGGASDRFFGELAKQHGVVIVGSAYEITTDGKLFDTATVHAQTGELIGVTRKIHIPSGDGYHETDFFAGFDQFPVTKLDALTLAAPTCYDQWFPELARIYSLSGAELIVYPTAIGAEPNDPDMDSKPAWETIMRGHAIANGVFVAAVNRVGTENSVKFYGSSFVCSPSGEILAQAGRDAAEVVVADLNPSDMTRWRHHFPLLHQRRPQVYRDILQSWSGDERPDWVEDTPIHRTRP